VIKTLRKSLVLHHQSIKTEYDEIAHKEKKIKATQNIIVCIEDLLT
jgi:hypothetical protein